jgi:RNA polymerase sigma-70 factor (ECF subfamily)
LSKELELARAYLLGDPDAVARIDAWILPVVRHRAWRLAGEAEDLAQETRFKLLRLFRSGAFRGDSSLKTYVQATAKYTALDAVRRARVRQTEELDGEHFRTSFDEPHEELERAEDLRMCVRVLSALPEGCRRLLRLVLEGGMTYHDISRELNVATGTVKSRLARCRDRAVRLRAAFLEGGRWE